VASTEGGDDFIYKMSKHTRKKYPFYFFKKEKKSIFFFSFLFSQGEQKFPLGFSQGEQFF